MHKICTGSIRQSNLHTNKSKTSSDGLEIKRQKFTYSEVQSITDNFKVVIGKGGFGEVYHGYIGDVQVAVKMLSASFQQGDKEFQAEVMFPSCSGAHTYISLDQTTWKTLLLYMKKHIHFVNHSNNKVYNTFHTRHFIATIKMVGD